MKSTSVTLFSLALLALTVSCRKETDKLSNKEKLAASCPRVAALQEQKAEPLYKVTTFAGANEEASNIDGTLCKARFESPQDIVINSDGVLFISDAGGSNIRKISKGLVSTVSGPKECNFCNGFFDGPPNKALFNLPSRITIDNTGNLFVLDQTIPVDSNGLVANAIRKISPENITTTYKDATLGNPPGNSFEDGPMATARFRYFMSFDFSAENELYIVDYRNALIRKVSEQNVVSTFAGVKPINNVSQLGFRDGTKEQALFQYITDIAFSSDGTLYVNDKGNKRIRKINNQGIVETLAQLDVNRITVDADGTLYACDLYTIYKISRSGTVTPIAGTGKSAYKDGIGLNASFLYLADVAAHDKYLYVADSRMIRRITIK